MVSESALQAIGYRTTILAQSAAAPDTSAPDLTSLSPLVTSMLQQVRKLAKGDFPIHAEEAARRVKKLELASAW